MSCQLRFEIIYLGDVRHTTPALMLHARRKTISSIPVMRISNARWKHISPTTRAYFVARQFYAVSFGLIICVCTSRLENSGICEALEKVTDARSREPKIDAVELFRAS